MDDTNQVVERLVTEISEVFDGVNNADVAHALVVIFSSMILTQFPPQKRSQVLLFLFKQIRELVKQGTAFEQQRMQ